MSGFRFRLCQSLWNLSAYQYFWYYSYTAILFETTGIALPVLTWCIMGTKTLISTSPRSIISKEFKKGNQVSFLTPVFMLWGSGHIGRHAWRWVIVPSDLARTFAAICAHYHYRVIHRGIIYMRAWFKSTPERQLTLNETAVAGLVTKNLEVQ